MFGVCYYPEHWPESQWPTDATRMAELGLSVVRIGEFAWSRLEPQPGQLEFEWLDRALDTLAAEGLGVIIGTPTATPPKWLIDQYPDILATDPSTGRVRRFGSRRHYDFSSADYRRESLRITAMLADRYGQDPRIVGWQTDNELGCHDTTLSISPAAVAAFRVWCAERYGSIDTLNAAWGNVFWSMEYRDFDAIDAPYGTVTEPNPAHQLAYRRFASDQLIDFHGAMVAALRARIDQQQFVTHNFIPMSDTAADNAALAAPLDFPSYDSYPLGRTDEILHDRVPAEEFAAVQRTGHPDLTAFLLDQVRALGDRPFWIMEQQPGPVNWAPANPSPLPGMVRLWTIEAFAHGADCVSFFRWRQAPFAQEQMHAGLRRPDDAPARRWPEIAAVIAEVQTAALSAPTTVQAPVALLTDVDSEWITNIERQSADYRLGNVQLEFYRAFRELGLNIDIVSANDPLDHYALVAVPCLASIDTSFVERAKASKAQIIFGPRSGSKTREFCIPAELAPGPLQKPLGLVVTEVETLRPGARDAFQWRGQSYRTSLWREHLEVSQQHVAAHFDDGGPAVVQVGSLSYLASLPDRDFLVDYFAAFCKQRGIATQRLPDGVRLRRRGDLTFAFNYSHSSYTIEVPTNSEFVIGNSSIGPQDLAVWRNTNNKTSGN
ncbi:MAG: beta-galactosidase [Pseudomonadota bacterium]